jgi:hypothetical protein
MISKSLAEIVYLAENFGNIEVIINMRGLSHENFPRHRI